MNQLEFIYRYYVIWGLRKILFKCTKIKFRNKYYGGRDVISASIANRILYEKIIEEESFFAGRYGSNELRAIVEIYRYEILGLKTVNFKKFNNLDTEAGFNPCGNVGLLEYIHFRDIMEMATQLCDLCGVWYNPMEDWVCKKKLMPNAILTHRKVFDFWEQQVPFTYALKGKKVLVIHPFVETIEKQFKNREVLFNNPLILPDFELYTIKAVQTIAGEIDTRFDNWFEALDYMYLKSKEIEYDVALIGCGAYGYPLAAKMKAEGKVIIHMGGVLQILFGIKGGDGIIIPQPPSYTMNIGCFLQQQKHQEIQIQLKRVVIGEMK